MSKRKPKTVATVAAEPQPEIAYLPELEFAVDTVKCGGFFEVVQVGKEMFRVNEPDPVGAYNLRSFITADRLREIALLKRDDIKAAIRSAPDQSRPIYLGSWKSVTQYTATATVESPTNGETTMTTSTTKTTATKSPLLKPKDRKAAAAGASEKAVGPKEDKAKPTATSTKTAKPTSKKAATKKAGKEPALPDAEVKKLIAKALKAKVPNKKYALEAWIRSQGHKISHERVGRLMTA